MPLVSLGRLRNRLRIDFYLNLVGVVLLTRFSGWLTQLVEYLAFNQGVPGSNPGLSISNGRFSSGIQEDVIWNSRGKAL